MRLAAALLLIPLLCFAEIRYPLLPVAGSKGCGALALHGEYLYAAGNDLLSVYRVTEPHAPRKCGELAIRGTRQIAISGNYLYLSARNWGVQVIDISNPEKPELVHRIDTAELATGLETAGNLLCVTIRVYGVQLFDISDPLRPRHLSLLRTGEAQSAFYFNGKLAVGDWGSSRLTIADISDPYRPRILSSAPLDGFGDGVWVHGNLCYAATGHHARKGTAAERHGRGHGLEIFDITDPARPVRLGGIKFPRFYEIGNDFWTVRSDGRTAFVGDTHNGFFAVDVSDPASPRLLGRGILPPAERYSAAARKKITGPDCVTDVAVGDGVVYLAGQKTGLFVVPVGKRAKKLTRNNADKLNIPPSYQYPVPAGLVRHSVPGVVRRLALRGDELFAACSDDGIRRFRISPEGQLTETAHWNGGGTVYDVATAGSDLLLAARGSSLDIYRVSDSGIRKLSSLPGSFYRPFQVIHPFGSVVLCSGGGSWLEAVDISDPKHPGRIGADTAGSLLYSDGIPERTVSGIFPVNWHGRGIRWYSTASGKLERLPYPASQEKLTQLSGITALGNLFIAPVRQGYLLLDPASGSAERVRLSGESPAGIPSWDGGSMVAFSDRRNGIIRVFNFKTPRHAVLKRSYKLDSGIPDRVVFHRGKMLIPGWNLGILIEKTADGPEN